MLTSIAKSPFYSNMHHVYIIVILDYKRAYQLHSHGFLSPRRRRQGLDVAHDIHDRWPA